MSKLETNTIDTVSGTSTLQVGSTNTSTITLGVSGDTINVPSGVTINNNGTQTGFGGTNTPAFQASMSGDQSINNDVSTKVQFNTETFDTASAYDTSAYRFTPQTAGKYYVYFKVELYGGATNDLNTTFLQIKKNGSTEINSEFSSYPDNILHKIFIYNAGVINFNGSSDYVEAFAQGTGGGSTQTIKSPNKTSLFGAYKIIE